MIRFEGACTLELGHANLERSKQTHTALAFCLDLHSGCRLFEKSGAQVAQERFDECQLRVKSCREGALGENGCLKACIRGEDPTACERTAQDENLRKKVIKEQLLRCGRLDNESCRPLAYALQRESPLAAALIELRACKKNLFDLCLSGAKRSFFSKEGSLGRHVGFFMAHRACIYGSPEACALILKEAKVDRPTSFSKEQHDRLSALEPKYKAMSPSLCEPKSNEFEFLVRMTSEKEPQLSIPEDILCNREQANCIALQCFLGKEGACNDFAEKHQAKPLIALARLLGGEQGVDELCDDPQMRLPPKDTFDACVYDNNPKACQLQVAKVHQWDKAEKECRNGYGKLRACWLARIQKEALTKSIHKQGGILPSASTWSHSPPIKASSWVLWVKARTEDLSMANQKTIVFQPIWAPRGASQGDICAKVGCQWPYTEMWIVKGNYHDEVFKYWLDNKRIVGGLGFVGMSKLDPISMCEHPWGWIPGCP